MSNYNNYRATPGNKANLKLLMNKAYLTQNFSAFNTSQTFENINNGDQITEGTLCQCLPFRSNPTKQGYNDPSQTQNQRFTVLVSGILGGKTTFGNINTPIKIDYLGGWEGQPGGSFRPPKNQF